MNLYPLRTHVHHGGRNVIPPEIVTVEQFYLWAQTMRSHECFTVGPAHSGWVRDIYFIGPVPVYCDAYIPFNPFSREQSVEYWWTGHHLSRMEADVFAAQYGATVIEAYYADGQFMLQWRDAMEGCMRWLWTCEPSIHAGKRNNDNQ
jgi:hypothetical protein